MGCIFHTVHLECTRILISGPWYYLDPYSEVNGLCVFAVTFCKAMGYATEFQGFSLQSVHAHALATGRLCLWAGRRLICTYPMAFSASSPNKESSSAPGWLAECAYKG